MPNHRVCHAGETVTALAVHALGAFLGRPGAERGSGVRARLNRGGWAALPSNESYAPGGQIGSTCAITHRLGTTRSRGGRGESDDVVLAAPRRRSGYSVVPRVRRPLPRRVRHLLALQEVTPPVWCTSRTRPDRTAARVGHLMQLGVIGGDVKNRRQSTSTSRSSFSVLSARSSLRHSSIFPASCRSDVLIRLDSTQPVRPP